MNATHHVMKTFRSTTRILALSKTPARPLGRNPVFLSPLRSFSSIQAWSAKCRSQLCWPLQHQLPFTLSGLFSLQPSDDAPSLWLALGVFIGLPTVLWAYKSLIMYLFQRKIVYMGYAPIGARTEELGRDVRISPGLHCEEVCIPSDKNGRLYGIYTRKDHPDALTSPPTTIVIYLQGNAGNPLGRLPVFERLLSNSPTNLAALAVAPRSYWKSTPRRATERGILSDYRHVLQYATARYPDSSIVLYGHSLGGAVAVCLASQLKAVDYPSVKGVILENPFASIPGMVKALYPQRWLPYHHMGPLVFDKWDALSAMRNRSEDSLLQKLSQGMLVLLSEKDEIVPVRMGEALYETSCMQGNDQMDSYGGRRVVIVKGALHDDAWTKRGWIVEVSKYLATIHRTL